MGRFGNLVALGMVAASIALASTAPAAAQEFAALPRVEAPMASVGEAKPLPAWSAFCVRYAAECAVDRSEPAVVTLSPRTMALITGVNKRVNATIRPVTDADHWGRADVWDLAEDGSGDCEDYQLLKRKLLADAGLPRRAMRMTVVVDEKGEGHAILMIRTDRGDITLDNKIDAVLPWAETGYVFVKRESQDDLAWVSLGRATSPTVTARNR